ncbi:MAG: hypothetical protein ACRDPO_04310 [Streptosporangiaceae bacterium]
MIDEVCAGRPAWLFSYDVHTVWLNTEALRRWGASAARPEVPFGTLEIDRVTGEPAGWARGSRSLSRGVWGTVRLVPDELLFDEDCDDEDDGGGPAVTIIEERPPLRAGKVFVDYGERAAISENLEAAYVALNQAFRGIWTEKALEYGHVREYWDEEDIDELEMLTLDASSAVTRAWRALSDLTDAHAAQREAGVDTGEIAYLTVASSLRSPAGW